jgi:RHS repeat-associated protein
MIWYYFWCSMDKTKWGVNAFKASDILLDNTTYGVQTDAVRLKGMRNRYYSPTLGRFINQDPYWNPYNAQFGTNPVVMPGGALLPDLEAIRQSGNLYSYVMGNPIMYVDPLGLVSQYSNIPTGKNMPLGQGWYYRYDIDQSGGKDHIHIHKPRGNHDYSQNEDGSNHHKPKGASGPPKKIQDKLKEKTGWDWDAKARSNAESAVVNKCRETASWTITYADGSRFSSWDLPYFGFWIPEPTIEDIIQYYYRAFDPCMGLDSDEGSIPPIFTPLPNPVKPPITVPIRFPVFIPLPV